MTTKLEITIGSAEYGYYRGDCEADALDNMARSWGYDDYADVCATLGDDIWLRPSAMVRKEQCAECAECATERETRTCEGCGHTASVIDCGHHQQPAEVAASEDGQRWVCEDCADAEVAS